MTVRLIARTVCFGVAIGIGGVGCTQLTNPGADVELQQSLYDLQDLLVQMREETSLLQSQVDSLSFVVARQDTSLRRIANLIGAPVP